MVNSKPEKIPLTEGKEEDETQVFEWILQDLGGVGRWNWQVILTDMVLCVSAGIQTMSYPMLTGSSSAWSYACLDDSAPANVSVRGLESCDIITDNGSSVHCYNDRSAHMEYENPYFGETVTTDFDLFCGPAAYIAPLVHSSFTIGCFFGVFLFGWLADVFGRRRVLCFGVPAMIVLSFLLALSPNIYIFLAIRSLQGMAVFGCFTVMFIITLETTPENKRATMGLVVHIPWGFQFFTVSLVALFIKNWRLEQTVQSIPSILCLIVFLLPESPRWLTLQGRIDEAFKVLVSAGQMNGVILDKKLLLERLERMFEAHIKTQKVAKKTLALGLVKTPQMRKRMFFSGILWFQGALVNHGFNFYAPSVAANPFLSYSILGFGEVWAPIVGSGVFSYGRRVPIAVSYAACSLIAVGIFLLLWLLEEDSQAQKTSLLLLLLFGVFLSDMAFNGLYVYTSELLPTTHRSVGLGTCSSMARIGSTLSSYVAMLGDFGFYLPPAIFFGLALTGAVSAWALPTTDNCVLPDTVSDVETKQKQPRPSKLAPIRPTPESSIILSRL